MAILSAREIILLALFSAVVVVRAEFQIVEPIPEPVYPIEHSSTEVTCVAYDPSGAQIPYVIIFVRKDGFAKITNLTDNDNLYFTNRTEEDGRKLFVTMHIRNVTEKDDSTSLEGDYECRAYSINYTKLAKYGFSVNVITANYIPEVTVSKVKILEHDVDASLLCNMTKRGRKETQLQRVSWFKDGVVRRTVKIPKPLGPLVLKDVGVRDGGKYTCILEVLLRGERAYNVTDSTVISIAPWFEDEGEKEIMKETGEDAKLKCSAKGFPLSVEWKFKNKSDEVVNSCIGSSKNKRYKVTRKGIYDPYYLTITNLAPNDTGSYFCCLPSNCSVNIDEDRCQRFNVTVEEGDVKDVEAGSMALVCHSLLVALALFMTSSLFL